METLYTNRGFNWRNNVSVAVLVIVAIYGLWELWHGATGGTSDGLLFGAAFVGGSIWGARELVNEVRDRVMMLLRDPATGATDVVLWRPFRHTHLTGGPDALTDWQSYVTVGRRNSRTLQIRANHADHPRTLIFDTRQGIDLSGLAKVAPEAVKEYGKAAGQPV